MDSKQMFFLQEVRCGRYFLGQHFTLKNWGCSSSNNLDELI